MPGIHTQEETPGTWLGVLSLDAYVVYADWLQQHGALRGELAALQAATSKQADDEVLGAAARDHLRTHALVAFNDQLYCSRSPGQRAFSA